MADQGGWHRCSGEVRKNTGGEPAAVTHSSGVPFHNSCLHIGSPVLFISVLEQYFFVCNYFVSVCAKTEDDNNCFCILMYVVYLDVVALWCSVPCLWIGCLTPNVVLILTGILICKQKHPKK